MLQQEAAAAAVNQHVRLHVCLCRHHLDQHPHRSLPAHLTVSFQPASAPWVHSALLL